MIKVVTSNTQIWNTHSVVSQITHAMINDEDIVLAFDGEGPDVNETVLDTVIPELANLYTYDTKRITIFTANQVQKHDTFTVKYTHPFHLVENTRDYALDYTKQIVKHFGIFIGRGNGPRLDLASYLYTHFKYDSFVTYHYVQNPIGLEELVSDFQIDISVPASFLKHCPIVDNTIELNAQSDLNPAQQLLKHDNDTFLARYRDFLVEIVCETCYNGNTFFPTEKTWRPILLETPFIVQGPQWYLLRLKDMGFQTFDRWWDEGYAEDPADHQPLEIIKIIDAIKTKSIDELTTMHEEMKPILEHNLKCLMNLSEEDFTKCRVDF